MLEAEEEEISDRMRVVTLFAFKIEIILQTTLYVFPDSGGPLLPVHHPADGSLLDDGGPAPPHHLHDPHGLLESVEYLLYNIYSIASTL